MPSNLKNGRDAAPASAPSNDGRPNSGLREGDISHAEVNAALRDVPKTVIFGQQNRLRDGLLMPDEKLSRFHAGHHLVRFFYQGLHKLPEYLLDALLESDISVTLVTGKDLLVFRDVRNHQSFHVGYTRKTLYMPEGVIHEAIEKGYDSWAISEALIREAWPLLDYLLILEFIRNAQQRFRTHFSLGSPEVVKNALRRLNRHLVESDRTEDSEFMAFYRHYCNDFFAMNRKIVGKDPYRLADGIFDECRERSWADVKLSQIATTFEYPTYFDLDRDIVHQAAFQAAGARDLPVEPRTVEDLLHDLRDAARFRVLRQTKTDALLDGLLESGEPGIVGFIDAVADEYPAERRYITDDQHDGYDAVDAFREKLQALSTSPIEGLPGSISNDFRDLLKYRTSRTIHALFQRFTALPAREQRENRPYLKRLVSKIVGTANLKDPAAQAQLGASVAHAKSVKVLLGIAEQLLGPEDPLLRQSLLLNILQKLDRHPAYHTRILAQVRRLTGDDRLSFGADIRDSVDALYGLIPDQPYRKSSDPNRLRTCLDRYRTLRRTDPNNTAMFTLLAGAMIRLDRADNYAELVDRVRLIGEYARPALREVLDKTNRNDPVRRAIRQTAGDLLESL